MIEDLYSDLENDYIPDNDDEDLDTTEDLECVNDEVDDYEEELSKELDRELARDIIRV
jgi:hypothetical protein